MKNIRSETWPRNVALRIRFIYWLSADWKSWIIKILTFGYIVLKKKRPKYNDKNFAFSKWNTSIQEKTQIYIFFY